MHAMPTLRNKYYSVPFLSYQTNLPQERGGKFMRAKKVSVAQEEIGFSFGFFLKKMKMTVGFLFPFW